MKYERILRAICATPWAIMPEKLEAIVEFIQMKANGFDAGEQVLAEIRAANDLQAARAQSIAAGTPGGVAILPLVGLLSHRMNLMSEISGPGGTSLDKYTQAFRQCMADPNCKAIVLDVDSPGGSIDGVPELADEIYRARGKKAITAVANTLNASAAYWISSAADEVVASPSAMVGSIGVFTAHTDISKALETEGIKVTLISAGKYKTEGNQYEPLDDDGVAALQAMVDEAYASFTSAVGKHRGVKVETVESRYGQGRVVSASRAKKAGMVDRVGTLDDVLKKFGVSRASGGSQMSGEAEMAVDCLCAHAIENWNGVHHDPRCQMATPGDATGRAIAELRRRLELAGA